MTEADLQNRAYKILSTILPTFQKVDISCQGSFSLKFGHHNVVVDGKEPGKYANRGIFDLLVFIKGEPKILLELKRPELTITDEDIKQGISYARLTDQITPITIISNGTDTRVFNTITKKPFSGSVIDEQIMATFSTGLNIAALEIQNSLETIIKYDQSVFFDLINNISEESFEKLTGEVAEFHKPIIKKFCVPRDILDPFIRQVKEKQFVLLTGDAYTGKTTLLYQFFAREKQTGNAVLFINSGDIVYSIFKKLATHLTGLLKFFVDENKVREWLLFSINGSRNKTLTIIFDHLRYDSPGDLFSHIAELLDIFKYSKDQMVACSDLSNYKLLKTEDGRNRSKMIGAEFSPLKLKTFSSKEYYRANEIVEDNFRMGILLGGVYALEYRTPRIWRLLIHDLLEERPDENHIGYIESVPSIGFINIFRKIVQLDRQLVIDLIKLSTAYIESIPILGNDSELRLMALNLGVVEETQAKIFLTEDVINRLLLGGFIEKRPIRNLRWVYVPKLPELVAGYSIEYLIKKFVPLFEADFEKNYQEFLSVCEYLPYGELVAAKVILDIGYSENVDLFSKIMSKLLFDKPTKEVTESEKLFGMYVEGIGSLKIHSGEGIEDSMLGNGFPFLILSYLATTPFGDDSDTPHMIRFKAIVTVASESYTVRRADHSFFHDGITTFEFKGLGDFIKTNIGIVEPIVLALKLSLLNFPNDFNRLFDFAKKENMFQLLHRIYIAARNTVGFGDHDTDKLCAAIEQSYEYEILPKMMAYSYTDGNADRTERRRIEKKLRKERLKRS